MRRGKLEPHTGPAGFRGNLSDRGQQDHRTIGEARLDGKTRGAAAAVPTERLAAIGGQVASGGREERQLDHVFGYGFSP